MEAIHLTLNIRAMYTTQHAHSIAQVVATYRQAHSINTCHHH
jgi:hypothetical protein